MEIENFGGGDIKVVAVENNPQIAQIYKDFFPDDEVIIADAHQYLLEHFKEFDFIWSSPPCPSHSKIRLTLGVGTGQNEAIYPDMKLYEEILLLKHYFKGEWVVENVVSYYTPLIKPYEVERHYFWSSFVITKKDFDTLFRLRTDNNKTKQEALGFDVSKYKEVDKTKILRNCVAPEVGLFIFNLAFKEKQEVLL